MDNQDFLIVGLGNPGNEYEETRHNLGFLVLDALLEAWRGPELREKWDGLYGVVTVRGHKIHLLKPVTYMNRSGASVAQLCRFYKLISNNIVVIQDDLDMAPCRVKFVKGGGSGGHKGINSIVDKIGTKDFFRLKIGIGRPGQGGVHEGFPVEKYVLGRIENNERKKLDDRMLDIINGIELFLEGDSARAIGVLNSLK